MVRIRQEIEVLTSDLEVLPESLYIKAHSSSTSTTTSTNNMSNRAGALNRLSEYVPPRLEHPTLRKLVAGADLGSTRRTTTKKSTQSFTFQGSASNSSDRYSMHELPRLELLSERELREGAGLGNKSITIPGHSNPFSHFLYFLINSNSTAVHAETSST